MLRDISGSPYIERDYVAHHWGELADTMPIVSNTEDDLTSDGEVEEVEMSVNTNNRPHIMFPTKYSIYHSCM